MTDKSNYYKKPPESPILRARARAMRHAPTDAELKLWDLLRRKQLDGFKFRRQAVIGGFIADFYCPRLKLIIELDGGQHFDPQEISYDEGRTKALAKLGVRVIRFSDIDVLKNPDGALQAIYDVVSNSKDNPPPP